MGETISLNRIECVRARVGGTYGVRAIRIDVVGVGSRSHRPAAVAFKKTTWFATRRSSRETEAGSHSNRLERISVSFQSILRATITPLRNNRPRNLRELKINEKWTQNQMLYDSRAVKCDERSTCKQCFESQPQMLFTEQIRESLRRESVKNRI